MQQPAEQVGAAEADGQAAAPLPFLLYQLLGQPQPQQAPPAQAVDPLQWPMWLQPALPSAPPPGGSHLVSGWVELHSWFRHRLSASV